jgi:DNA-binding MarR family transcriptional regulator
MPKPRHAAPASPAFDAAFAAAGDRFIHVIREMRRNRHQRLLQRQLYSVGAFELTAVQVDILETVLSRPASRMGDIAAQLGVDASTATRTLAPLIELGMLQRGSAPNDRRAVTIEVTAAGRAEAARIAVGRAELMRAVFHRLSPERMLQLTDLLEEYMLAVVTEAKERIGG